LRHGASEGCPYIHSIELSVNEKEQLLYQLMAELDLSGEPVELAEIAEDFGNCNE